MASRLVFDTASGHGRVPIRVVVLECDVFAYRRAALGLGASDAEADEFIKIHLSDVSVSRFVKCQRFCAIEAALDGTARRAGASTCPLALVS